MSCKNLLKVGLFATLRGCISVVLRDVALVKDEQSEDKFPTLSPQEGSSPASAGMPEAMYPFMQRHWDPCPVLENTGAKNTRWKKGKSIWGQDVIASGN